MLLGDFLDQYSARKKERQAFRNICKENLISYSKLPDLLKDLGFKYDRASFDWIWQGTEDPPLNLDLISKIPMRAAVQQKHSRSDKEEAQKQIAAGKDTAQQQKSSAADPQQPQILYDQLFDIVDLLQQINKKIPAAPAVQPKKADPEADPEAAPLALQLHRINQSQKARKTINISEAAASWLDNYSAAKGFKIGDLVTLAILQLKDKIDK